MSLFGPRHRPGDLIEVAGARVVLKVNRRARRVSVRIDAARNEAVATAPSERRLSEAAAFAQERAGWIAARLAERPRSTPFAPGSSIPFRGEKVRLEAIPGGSAAQLVCGVDGSRIVSGGEGTGFERRIERFLRAEARRTLEARTETHAERLGLKPPKIGIADPGSRWGSCTPSRSAIRYSWRLILAPHAVLDYVAAHETAHLVHADHSQRFWTVVRLLVGDEKPARRWLRAHGAALHAIGRPD